MKAATRKAAPIKVLGLTLQPMTLGHRFLLAKHDSAFLTGEPATIADLMLAALVCSQPWRIAERMLNCPQWIFGLFVWLWSQTLRFVLIPIEFNKFHVYFSREHSFPEVEAQRSEDEVESPFELRLLTMLMSEFHLTREQALDMEIAEATSLWAAQGERKGAHRIRNDRLKALWAYARERDMEKFGRN